MSYNSLCLILNRSLNICALILFRFFVLMSSMLENTLSTSAFPCGMIKIALTILAIFKNNNAPLKFLVSSKSVQKPISVPTSFFLQKKNNAEFLNFQKMPNCHRQYV